MMRHDKITNALEITCPFPHFFDEVEEHHQFGSGYRRKIVHIRADYDGRKWWNTIWPYHDELATPEIRREVDTIYEALISKEAFPNLDALRSFCAASPQALANERATNEYNFYLESVYCGYWLRCITRDNDYNLYLHAFLLSDSTRQMYSYLDELEVSQPALDMGNASTLLKQKFPALTADAAAKTVSQWKKRFQVGGTQNGN